MRILALLEKYWFLGILLAVSLIAVQPFFNPGFFPIHDDTQVQRVFVMKESLSEGMFPVRWVSELGYGYGYPIFNFYAPLAYYLGALISLLGVNALLATKIMIALGVAGSSFSMYLFAKEFWGKPGGLLSSVLYLLAPYHALNTYVRGDVGEIYAYLFIPLIFYGIWKYYREARYKFLVVGALSYSSLILSHNLSALMLTPFIIIVVLFLIAKKKDPRFLLIPIFGILIASFYFIPALLEMSYTNVQKIVGEEISYSDHFVCIPQIWDSIWMYGGSIPGCVDGLSFRLGKIHIILSLLSLISALFLFGKERLRASVIFMSISALAFSLFLMTEYSKEIWNTVSYMNFFQFPWRFLLVASFISSFIGGSAIYFLSKSVGDKGKVFTLTSTILFIFFSLFLYSKLFVPSQFINKTSNEYTNEAFLNWEISRISDEYLPKNFRSPQIESEIIKDKITGKSIQVLEPKEKTGFLSAQVIAKENTIINIQIPYFPAWSYYLNGKKVEVKETPMGVSFEIPKGENEIIAKFEQTPIEKISNFLSLSSILILVAGIIYAKSKKKN